MDVRMPCETTDFRSTFWLKHFFGGDSSLVLAATMAPVPPTRRKIKSADDTGGVPKRQRAASSSLGIQDALGGVSGKVYAQVQQAWAAIEGHEVFHDFTNLEPLQISSSGDSGTHVPSCLNTFKMV